MQQQDAPTASGLAGPVLEFIKSTQDKLDALELGYFPEPLLAELNIQCKGLDFNTGEPINGGDKFFNPLDNKTLDSIIKKYWSGDWPLYGQEGYDRGGFYNSKRVFSLVMYYMTHNSNNDEEKIMIVDHMASGWDALL